MLYKSIVIKCYCWRRFLKARHVYAFPVFGFILLENDVLKTVRRVLYRILFNTQTKNDGIYTTYIHYWVNSFFLTQRHRWCRHMTAKLDNELNMSWFNSRDLQAMLDYNLLNSRKTNTSTMELGRMSADSILLESAMLCFDISD